jgi:hypothetical protein
MPASRMHTAAENSMCARCGIAVQPAGAGHSKNGCSFTRLRAQEKASCICWSCASKRSAGQLLLLPLQHATAILLMLPNHINALLCNQPAHMATPLGCLGCYARLSAHSAQGSSCDVVLCQHLGRSSCSPSRRHSSLALLATLHQTQGAPAAEASQSTCSMAATTQNMYLESSQQNPASITVMQALLPLPCRYSPTYTYSAMCCVPHCL